MEEPCVGSSTPPPATCTGILRCFLGLSLMRGGLTLWVPGCSRVKASFACQGFFREGAGLGVVSRWLGLESSRGPWGSRKECLEKKVSGVFLGVWKASASHATFSTQNRKCGSCLRKSTEPVTRHCIRRRSSRWRASWTLGEVGRTGMKRVVVTGPGNLAIVRFI